MPLSVATSPLRQRAQLQVWGKMSLGSARGRLREEERARQSRLCTCWLQQQNLSILAFAKVVAELYCVLVGGGEKKKNSAVQFLDGFHLVSSPPAHLCFPVAPSSLALTCFHFLFPGSSASNSEEAECTTDCPPREFTPFFYSSPLNYYWLQLQLATWNQFDQCVWTCKCLPAVQLCVTHHWMELYCSGTMGQIPHATKALCCARPVFYHSNVPTSLFSSNHSRTIGVGSAWIATI